MNNQTPIQRLLLKPLRRVGIDGFLLAILLMVLLAWIMPGPGNDEGPFSPGQLSNYGLSLVFLFYGLKLSPRKLRKELVNWRMHLLVQATTFILFPLLILCLKPLINPHNPTLWLGLFYLAALPSTVSSSVVMVSIANGNIPSAIFNASISTLAGIFITPLWMLPMLESGQGDIDTSGIMLKLVAQVLVPVAIGLLLNKKFGQYADRYKKQLRLFDQSVILLTIYVAFCHSFSTGVFDHYPLLNLLLLGAGVSLLFFIVYFITTAICRRFGFSRADRITTVFCGSKKSLVHGTVMSKILFANSPAVSLILLPLMLYHALQLIFVSGIAQRMAREEHSTLTQISS